ncbi:DNA mismatch repair protein MutS [Anaeromicrobium sediminis]|uniref:DNA mismatch repair protein MutS n=1 Tax=Anaeromicrobium sediminis TaxID=1478221 RepID=A0A267MQU2_9FIRM|nr:DNA mismatch repair protein MutS [Anaeromicrobium sediminis]PAB61143.1 DNA mismatch repair protein MutS [Anaeromicrobium sediminis]
MGKLTPMMRQYLDIKNKYKDCILFFRLGDFYEMFFEDAKTASRELEITLTGKSCGLEEKAAMCGVPFHSAQNYIAKLIEKGYKVAIAEQVEDASKAKGLVKRDVVKVVTPGTVMDAELLKDNENNYIMSIYVDEGGIGIAYSDISTGRLNSTQIIDDNPLGALIDEIVKTKPREIIINKNTHNGINIELEIGKIISPYISLFDGWAYDLEYGQNKILKQLNILSLDGIGLSDKNYSICAVGSLLEYIETTQKSSISFIQNIRFYYLDNYMVLDKFTRRNLELAETMREKSKKGSLLWVLDKTNTAMGARQIKKWVEEPLKNADEIQGRLDGVEELKNNFLVMEELKDYLKSVYDLERLAVRISYGNANGRDMTALKTSLEQLPNIKNTISNMESSKIKEIRERIDTSQEVTEIIENAIVENPPVTIKEGGIIKDGYNEELDELRYISRGGKEWISNLENMEKEKTGIKSLKIGFNKVFGYYIEVTKSNLSLVPEDYIRKQTLANAERYITPELKEVEAKVLGAQDKIVELEYDIFLSLREKIKEHSLQIQKTASEIAQLDALLSFAHISNEYNYVKPEINFEGKIHIENGRHPVVERMMTDEIFVGNDTLLNKDENRFSIITGPNMAGKSTYMRQVALITLMSQIGCFVPADRANIGIVDRIFTRVGASDDLAQGQSTFMVEMSELANILNNATKDSLIILDEIGRGTSTYDGLSIAWAVVEHISNIKNIGAKTLFATHYHELTDLEDTLDGVKNYCIDVKENDGNVVFLHKIIKGSADQSYGIEVAKLAGVKNDVIDRAKGILEKLESDHVKPTIDYDEVKEDKVEYKEEKIQEVEKEIAVCEQQLDFFVPSEDSKIVEELRKINILEMTPMDAMNELYKLKKLISK